jgi:DNA-binding beta-propeller fold protein YncE
MDYPWESGNPASRRALRTRGNPAHNPVHEKNNGRETMSSLTRRAVPAAVLLATLAANTATPAAPFMIVGDDEKPGIDAQGKPVINAGGNDAVLIVDLANPEAPKIVASLPLENSIVGPPTNLAISPNGAIALVADSMTVAEVDGARKLVPTEQLFVIDMKSSPPKLIDTLHVGKQPSGLSFSPKGDIALVCNRADGSITVLKIDGTKVTQSETIPISAGVAHVEFAPDGKHAVAVKSPDNKIAILDIDGDKVTYNKLDLPTYAFPYNVVISPDSKLAIIAGNGNNGSSDGNMDAVSVVDLEGPHPHVIAHLPVEDAPEGLAMSPDGKFAVVVNVNGSNMPAAWYHHKTGSVTILGITGKTVTPIKTLQVGTFPEAVMITPDSRYIYVGNFSDKDFSILKVNGTDVTDTGKRFSVPGHPASGRMGPR